ncbi:hypothetical protein TNCV_1507541 [Trichonephila clavipes]|nr:hypothetical protein TNCV_1507541 [Trichonephila clavipes]
MQPRFIWFASTFTTFSPGFRSGSGRVRFDFEVREENVNQRGKESKRVASVLQWVFFALLALRSSYTKAFGDLYLVGKGVLDL